MKKLLLTGVALGLGLAFSSAASAQIKIGVAGPITGPNAAFGAQLKNGVEQAVEDINAAGGINGQKLQVVVGDDVSDPKQGVSVANNTISIDLVAAGGHDRAHVAGARGCEVGLDTGARDAREGFLHAGCRAAIRRCPRAMAMGRCSSTSRRCRAGCCRYRHALAGRGGP